MRANDVSVTVTIDTEEDNWGSYHESGATTENISYLEELQDHFERWGARATYLVNRPPLMSSASVETLGRLATREGVEVGGHCHPWNSPPATGEGIEKSMMCNLPTEANRAKIADVRLRIETELGVRPTSFRAGRWGFGPTVSKALAAEGFTVDASVTPLIDWRPDGGPDYTFADPAPYRFDPNAPFQADENGTMVQIPTTVSFLRGDHFRMARLRAMLGKGPAKRLHAIGVSNRLGLVSRRWLSPEASSGQDMVRLVRARMNRGSRVLGLTFHSCTLLPGATPFVRDASDRVRFLTAIDTVLQYCSEQGLTFKTLREVAQDY